MWQCSYDLTSSLLLSALLSGVCAMVIALLLCFPEWCLAVVQVVQEAQRWCYSVTGGTHLPTLLHLSDEALSHYVTSLQVPSHNPVNLHNAYWILKV